MDTLIGKVSESELKVLRYLWNAGREMTLSEILSAVSSTTKWEPSTIKTLLYRLCKKGAVRREKRNVMVYSPLISARQYSDFATTSMINSFYGGSAKDLVCALLDSKHLSQSDITALRELFRVSSEKEGD